MQVSGPFEREEVVLWPNSLGRKSRNYAQWYRQRSSPGEETHRRPLTYQKSYCEAYTPGSDAPNLDAGYYASQTAVPFYWSQDQDDVHNRCWDKFVSKARAAASQVGASLGEQRQVVDMMTKRLWQLRNAATYLKRGYPIEFFKELGVLPGRWVPRRSDPKKAADLWLEWHFGWEPLYEDIHGAIQILQSPTPALIKVRVKANRAPVPHEETSSFPDWSSYKKMQGVIAEHMGARVTVSNPNAWKATQLGLVNPAAIAWELVPFSFVVDWFIPVGQFLNGFTDLYGISIQEPYTTYTRWYNSEYTLYDRYGVVTDHHAGRGFRMQRLTHVQGPSLSFRPWKGISVVRAVTALSVLTQVLWGLRPQATGLAGRSPY